MIAEFCAALSKTDLSRWIQATEWVVPMIQSVHILSVAVVMSSVLMLDLRLLGVAGRNWPIAKLEERFLPPVWIALLVLLATGLLLTIAEPRRELLNTVFRLKMLMVVVVTSLTLFLQHHARGAQQSWEVTANNRTGVKALAFVSLLLWVAILTAGRWIAYTVES